MPDYICKQKLLQEINSAENRKADNLMADWYYQMVNNQPTADVKEEVHAYWEETDRWGVFKCSNCGSLHVCEVGEKYCPNCGAKMDGKGE